MKFGAGLLLLPRRFLSRQRPPKVSPSNFIDSTIDDTFQSVLEKQPKLEKKTDVKKNVNRSISNRRSRAFIDSVRIHVRGGTGGQGLKKYGGKGGDGGNVYVKAVPGLTLKQFREKHEKRRFVADHGRDSSRRAILGLAGEDLIIDIPEGVQLLDDDGTEIGLVDADSDQVCVAQGGQGGGPSNNFLGLKAEARNVKLNYRLLADIGLVGFPNAGKSTFLQGISHSKTQIGAYPFTTLRPHLGTMEYDDFRQITVADLPGLIEGAHLNEGMGHKFLKHIERTKLMLFVVDVMGFQLSWKYHHRTAFETMLLLNRELELYNQSLLDKPAILALNKIDLDEGLVNTKKTIELVKNLPESLSAVDPEFSPQRLINFDGVVLMSAQNKTSLMDVKDTLRDRLDYFGELQLMLEKKEAKSFNKELLKEHSKVPLV